MIYDALVFDIDGTLWDTALSCTKALNQALESLGLTERVTNDQVSDLMGTPQEEAIGIFFPELIKQYPHLPTLASEYEMKVIPKKGGVFYPEVLEGIKTLSQHRPIFLVSNCEAWYLELFLKLSKLSDYLTGTDCWGNEGRSKTEMLLGFKKARGFKKGVYIGDTAHDQVAATQASLDFIFAAYGFGKVEGVELSFKDSEGLMSYLNSNESTFS